MGKNLWVVSRVLEKEHILFSIVSGIGSPICTDSVTAKPMYERTFGQYARVLVEIDLTQALRYKILVERKGYVFYVDLDYENVPDYCTYCRNIGHHVDFCKKWYPGRETRQEKEQQRSFKEPKQIFVQKKDGRVEQDITTEEVNEEKEVINVEDDNEEENRVENITASELLKIKGKAVVVAESPSNIMKQQDNELERELNLVSQKNRIEEMDKDDVSSNGSFVEATQHLADSQPLEDEEEEHIPTPERVQKDMEFLNSSWANMLDDVVVDNRLYEVQNPPAIIQQNIDDEGFQLQISKSKKKAQKKVSQAKKAEYTTRSKVLQRPSK